MRRLIAPLFTTVDGVVETPENWHFPYFDAVTALKNGDGGDIAISGSISIVGQLLDDGLVDELHLLVDPMAIRNGKRLFEQGSALPLALLKSNTFTNGVLHLVYGPAESRAHGSYRDASKAMAAAGHGARA